MSSVLAIPEMKARKTSRKGQALAIIGACAASSLGWLFGEDAFVGGTADRVAGRYVILEAPPEGLTCMNAAASAISPTRVSKKSGKQSYQNDRGMLWMDKTPAGPIPYPPELEEYKGLEWLPYTRGAMGEQTWKGGKAIQADCLKQWFHFNAEGKQLQPLAESIVGALEGSFSPLWHPQIDTGHFVIVTNCEKVKVLGKQYHYKLYFRCLSQRPGHLVVERFKDLQARFPERIIMQAVWGSMRRGKLARRIFKDRLKLFAGPNHLHYDKDPIDWPMHQIKDATPTDITPLKDQLENYYTKIAPAKKKIEEARKERDNLKRLAKFKNFLQESITENADAEKLSLDELYVAARRRQFDIAIEEKSQLEEPKAEVKMYPGTKIPVIKIVGARLGTEVQKNSKPDSAVR
jgi:large subunit ribosomal protein L13